MSLASGRACLFGRPACVCPRARFSAHTWLWLCPVPVTPPSCVWLLCVCHDTCAELKQGHWVQGWLPQNAHTYARTHTEISYLQVQVCTCIIEIKGHVLENDDDILYDFQIYNILWLLSSRLKCNLYQTVTCKRIDSGFTKQLILQKVGWENQYHSTTICVC